MVVYIFQNGDADLFAYSIDKTGANIPPRDRRYVWLLRSAIPDLRRVLPAAKADRVLADLTQLGFNASVDAGPWTWARSPRRLPAIRCSGSIPAPDQ